MQQPTSPRPQQGAHQACQPNPGLGQPAAGPTGAPNARAVLLQLTTLGRLEADYDEHSITEYTPDAMLNRLLDERDTLHQLVRESAPAADASSAEPAPSLGKVVMGLLITQALPVVLPLVLPFITRLLNGDAAPAAPTAEPRPDSYDSPTLFRNPEGGPPLQGFYCGPYDATANAPDLNAAVTSREMNPGDFFVVTGSSSHIPNAASAAQPLQQGDCLVWGGAQLGFMKGEVLAANPKQP